MSDSKWDHLIPPDLLGTVSSWTAFILASYRHSIGLVNDAITFSTAQHLPEIKNGENLVLDLKFSTLFNRDTSLAANDHYLAKYLFF